MTDMSEFDPLAPPRKDTESENDSDSESEPEIQELAVAPAVSSPPSEPSKQDDPEAPEALVVESNEESSPNTATEAVRRASVGSGTQSKRPDADEDRPFDFQQFLDQMRTKQADPIARYIKSFLTEFHKKSWTAAEQVKIIADFRQFIASKMKHCLPFSALDQKGWLNSQEGVEKLIMNRLYVRTFSPKMSPILRKNDHQEDLMRDGVFAERLRIWGWIEPQHLDIPPECVENESFVALACKQLNKINNFRAPRDKCICVLNCSKVIWALIRSADVEANADSFLPILIYVLLQAKASFLVSNLNYINRFRGENQTRGETAYYLSMISSAVAFVEGLDRTSLTISEDEYQHKIEAAVKAEKERPEELLEEQALSHDQQVNATSVLSVSAGLLVESLKSYANKIFEPDDIDTPEPATRPTSSMSENPEEVAAKQASAEEYRAREAQEKEFSQTLQTLTQMFPTLDKEVIEDVLREKGSRVGAAIDICLGLCE